MRGLSFCELAFSIISRFVDASSVPPDALKGIVDKSFSSFRSTGRKLQLNILHCAVNNEHITFRYS